LPSRLEWSTDNVRSVGWRAAATKFWLSVAMGISKLRTAERLSPDFQA